jgi:undecaprenyl-diphosphatase
MTLLHSLLLGILQGATEFIPVSSSGHLVLVPWALGWPNPDLAFDAVVHLGTLVAVVLVFWGDIVTLVGAWLRSVRERRIATVEARLAWLIVVSAVPGALLGCLLGDLFERMFDSPLAVSLLLLVTGLVLFGSAYLARGSHPISEVRLRDAILIGVMQALAIAPGISRSGMTIAAGLYSGLSRDAAARYSFLVGLPLIAGASAITVFDAAGAGLGVGEVTGLVVGFIAAALSGYLAIRFLLRVLSEHGLRPFAYYCWAAGGIGLAALALAQG